MHNLQCVYVIWRGDTPDKGVAFGSIVEYDRAREKLNRERITYRCAIIPVLPSEQAHNEIERIINEEGAKK